MAPESRCRRCPAAGRHAAAADVLAVVLVDRLADPTPERDPGVVVDEGVVRAGAETAPVDRHVRRDDRADAARANLASQLIRAGVPEPS